MIVKQVKREITKAEYGRYDEKVHNDCNLVVERDGAIQLSGARSKFVVDGKILSMSTAYNRADYHIIFDVITSNVDLTRFKAERWFVTFHA